MNKSAILWQVPFVRYDFRQGKPGLGYSRAQQMKVERDSQAK